MSPQAEPRRGPAEGFLIWQAAIACSVAAWSFGGRADGALYWIGALLWLSAFALFIDLSWWDRIRRNGIYPLGYWVVVLVVMAIGILNAQAIRVDLIDGSFELERRAFIPFLPAALEQKRAAAYGLLYSGAMVQAVMVWTFLRRREALVKLASLLAANILVLAVVGASFRLGGADKILGVGEPVADYFFASFRYHNHWTAYGLLGMSLSAALGLFHFHNSQRDAKARRQRKEVFWFSALFLISVTLPMSTARAGVLFNTLFWGWVLVALSRTLLRKGNASGFPSYWTRWRVPVFSGVLAVVVLLSAFSLWTVRDDMQRELAKTTRQLETMEAPGDLDAHRFTYAWRDTGRMIADAPVTGWGIGNHHYVWMLYATGEFRDADGRMRYEKEFAHNDWLQFTAELGIPAFLCLLAVPGILLIRLSRQGPLPLLAQWALVGPALVLLLAVFEFPLSNPAVAVLFFVQVSLALKQWKVVTFRQ